MKTMIATVDPGVSGGVAYQLGNGGVEAVKMPRMSQNMMNFIKEIGSKSIRRIVYIEAVGHFRGDKPEMRFGIDKMIRNHTEIRSMFFALGWTVIDVRPQDWQNELRLYLKGDDKRNKKRRFKEFAQSQFPNIKVTLNTADALCLLVYAKMIDNE